MHDSLPGPVGRRHDGQVILDRLGDSQEPLHRQHDCRGHRGHQGDGLQLVEEVDERVDLKII